MVNFLLCLSRCFRRSGATAAADNGATSLELKRHCGWSSESTALLYTENTMARKREICQKITGVNVSTISSNSEANDILPAQSSEESVHTNQPGSSESGTSCVQPSASSSSSNDQTKEMRIVTDARPQSKDGHETGTNVYHISLAGASNVTLNFR